MLIIYLPDKSSYHYEVTNFIFGIFFVLKSALSDNNTVIPAFLYILLCDIFPLTYFYPA